MENNQESDNLMLDSIVIRPMQQADHNFIMSSWLKSYRHDSYFAKRIRDRIYYKFHHALISNILERPSVSVLIAADKEDTSVIYGYLITESYLEAPIIHFSYVKAPFRKLGIAKRLVQSSEIDPNGAYISHWTEAVDEIIKKFPQMTYVPYLV